jgi:cytochrome c551/c552
MKPARLVLLVLVTLLASCHRIDHAAGRQAGRTGEYTPGKSGGSAHRGARLIVRYGCSSCHTLAAAGATGTVGPNLGTDVVPNAKKAHQSLKQYISESISKPNAYITPGFKANVMPQNFAQTLSPTQIQALVTFISGVTK